MQIDRSPWNHCVDFHFQQCGLVPYVPAQELQGYPVYQFSNPGKPYAVDLMNRCWQMQLTGRYSF